MAEPGRFWSGVYGLIHIPSNLIYCSNLLKYLQVFDVGIVWKLEEFFGNDVIWEVYSITS